MSNWRFVKEDRINIVKKIYKQYKTYGTLDAYMCDDYCVVASCKECSFKSCVDSQCVVGNSDCIRCWRDFMEFLDLRAKRNNLEVYDNE